MNKDSFYITTTLPYVNSSPHIGFGMEIVAADVIARYQAELGKEVFFNTGTDEHGQKIYEKALENDQSPEEYTDYYAEKFKELKDTFNLFPEIKFIRTTDTHHKQAAQEFWRLCNKNGYIYKKLYKIKYCIGCELEKQDSELIDGHCPLHPNYELEIREEENYFFAFSKFDPQLLSLYKNYPKFVKPKGKLKEISSFVSGGLQDFSISRLKAKMPWGVGVPDDPDHVMYVWFDALVNYISTLGWPKDKANFEKFWGTSTNPRAVQIAGKDNLRQQSAMWQAMLMAAGLPTSKQILINGFIGVDGQKMSKSLGNVISPHEMVQKYGIDGTRFLLMDLGPIGTDMDASWDKFDISFTAALSNGLGNLCSRVAKLCEKAEISGKQFDPKKIVVREEITNAMDNFELKTALDLIVSQIGEVDQYLSESQPWKKEGQERADILHKATSEILVIAKEIAPFLPETGKIITDHFSKEKITALKPLFPRV